MTYRAVGAVALLASLAVLMLGLGVAFAALFMKFAAELPPSGAAMISAFSLMAVGAGLALLARVFKPRTHAPAKARGHAKRSSRPRGAGPRAQPSEPILVPKLRIRFADFPCPHAPIDQRLLTSET